MQKAEINFSKALQNQIQNLRFEWKAKRLVK
jgi:hypothetical protein